MKCDIYSLEQIITPIGWLCSMLDTSAGMKKDSLKVLHQDDKIVRVLVKETGEVWEFKADIIRSAAR